MSEHRIYSTPFASVYPHYVKKAEAKGRTREELDEILRWLTGYTRARLEPPASVGGQFVGIGLTKAYQTGRPLTQAVLTKRWNPNARLITGTVCGIRVENIEDPLMQKIRWLDKLVDELAKGKKMEKILRSAE